MKRKVLQIIIPVLLFVILLTTAPLFFNTSSLKDGIVYLSYNGNAYAYHISSKKKEKIIIDGYDQVCYYFPIDNGYIAVVSWDNNAEVHEEQIVYNDTVLFQGDYIEQPIIKDDYVFYKEDQSHLSTVNIHTGEYFNLSDSVWYGYSFSDHYLYFNEGNLYTSNAEQNIVVIDIEKDLTTKNIIDQGSVVRNTYHKLVYQKENYLYEYDFSHNNSLYVDESNLINDKYYNRYLSAFKVENTIYSVHFCQPKFIDYRDYSEYENDLMKQKTPFDDIRLFGFIKISDQKGRIIIPTSTDSRVSVTAYQNNDCISYPCQACTLYIY